MAFLEVVTRAYRRPQMLRHNRASLERQTCGDWTQTILIDDVGRGIAWAYAQLATFEPSGEYLWILDDDDLCLDADLVADLKDITSWIAFDVIMLKMDHGNGHILPDDAHWERPPAQGYIGASAFVVSRATWMGHRHVFAPGRYESDYDFIRAVYAATEGVFWHDTIASKCQRVSKGLPE